MQLATKLMERLSRRLSRTLHFQRAVEKIVSQDRPGVSGRFIPLLRRDNVSFVGPSEPAGRLPVPPPHLWEGYAETEAEYLKCGQDDVAHVLSEHIWRKKFPQSLCVRPVGARRQNKPFSARSRCVEAAFRTEDDA